MVNTVNLVRETERVFTNVGELTLKNFRCEDTAFIGSVGGDARNDLRSFCVQTKATK